MPLPSTRPLLCAVTGGDLAAGRDSSTIVDAVVAWAETLMAAGLDLLHVREPGLPVRQLYVLVRALVERGAAYATRIIVNDRADVSLAAGAHGVHLRADSMSSLRVRRLVGSALLLGRSVHGLDEVVTESRDGAVDYLVFGTVFPPRSKPAPAALAGVDGLRAAVAESRVPVLAIGGITRDTIAAVAATGAAGFAAIDYFRERTYGGIETSRAGALAAAIEDARRRFGA